MNRPARLCAPVAAHVGRIAIESKGKRHLIRSRVGVFHNVCELRVLTSLAAWQGVWENWLMRILVVEDNSRMGDLIAQGLRARGFACDLASDLARAEDALAAATFDVMLLDAGLPDGDGLTWLRDRPRQGQPPTIVITARGGLEDRVIGLDAGADDYLAKPFAMDELAARVRAILRRPGHRAERVIEAGGLSFDPAGQIARVGEQRLDLTRRELHLFELLLRRAGQVVRRSQIEDSLYSFDESVSPNAIDAVVSRLRRRLEEAGQADRLHTIRGVGYLLSEA